MYEIKYRNENEIKNSGVNWLGKIPNDWSVFKAKYMWKKEKRPLKQEYGVVTCFRDGQVTLRENRRSEGYTFAIKEIGYQGVLKGDLVISAMDAFAGAMGISESEGKCSPVYSVCSPIIPLYRKYYRYLLNEISNKKYILSLAKGIRERSTDFRYNEFANMILTYPSINEQHKIANFLDINTAQFDSIISKKEKLIQKLEEAKKSLISEVVTGKVKIVDGKLVERNPSEMKDSSVEWLAMVPNDWEKSRVKFDTYVKGRIGWQGLKSDEFIEEGPYLVTGSDFLSGKIMWDNCYHINKKRFLEAPAIHLRNGDLLITKDGTIGKLAIVEECPAKATLNSGVFLTRCISNKYLTKFMFYILSSKAFDTYVELTSIGSTIKHLYQETFVNFSYVLPNLDEQQRIIDYLDLSVLNIVKLIDKTKQQVNMLKQAKQSLISETVTGKIDLRDWEIIEEGELQ